MPPQVVLLILMLFGSSNSLFSASSQVLGNEFSQKDQQAGHASMVNDQEGPGFDSVLPNQKDISFSNDSFGSMERFRNQTLYHSSTSQQYIKRSRYIFPSFGLKEIIFPFHVFL